MIVPGGSGTTVTSSPLTDGDAPYFWYETGMVAYEEYVSDVINADGLTFFRGTIDSKAMRVLRPDQEVQVVFESQALEGSIILNADVNCRFLIGD